MSTSATTTDGPVASLSQPGQLANTRRLTQAVDPTNGPGMVQSVPSDQGLAAGLPEAGGQSIGKGLDLRDIHMPAEPAFWPPAPGWWLLFALICVLAFWLGRFGWHQYQRLRRRQLILSELDRLQSAGLQAPALIAAVSALLKRVALSRYPRTEVAALTGDAWLDFLDRSGGNGGFAAGPGQALAQGAYAPAVQVRDPDFDAEALLAVARDWLRRNS
jgi:hypothetical protein